jgi:hypothetical protein
MSYHEGVLVPDVEDDLVTAGGGCDGIAKLASFIQSLRLGGLRIASRASGSGPERLEPESGLYPNPQRGRSQADHV